MIPMTTSELSSRSRFWDADRIFIFYREMLCRRETVAGSPASVRNMDKGRGLVDWDEMLLTVKHEDDRN